MQVWTDDADLEAQRSCVRHIVGDHPAMWHGSVCVARHTNLTTASTPTISRSDHQPGQAGYPSHPRIRKHWFWIRSA